MKARWIIDSGDRRIVFPEVEFVDDRGAVISELTAAFTCDFHPDGTVRAFGPPIRANRSAPSSRRNCRGMPTRS